MTWIFNTKNNYYNTIQPNKNNLMENIIHKLFLLNHISTLDLNVRQIKVIIHYLCHYCAGKRTYSTTSAKTLVSVPYPA